MQVGWIDFSPEERNRTLTVLSSLSEPGSVDELGVGVVRDAMADKLFPGTSTLLTKARYFFLVPYLSRFLEEGHDSSRQDPRALREQFRGLERNCAVGLRNCERARGNSDKGSMRVDVSSNSRTTGLLMLLEGMVHQVAVNWRRKDAFSSFHPKVWVVEYSTRSKGDSLYRLLVMSRNLSFDTSWDVVVSMDGHPGKGDACSEHVAQFLEFLADGDAQTSTDRDDPRRRGSHTTRVRLLAERIREARFEVNDRNFESVDFFPFGPQGDNVSSLLDARKCDLLTWRWRSMLVVSPFLSEGSNAPLSVMARHRSGASGKYVLLSREDSLAELSSDMRASYECFCPASSLADVELEGEDGVDASAYSNLHAKLYFSQDMSDRRRLWIGSLNASRNGTINNVEALLALSVRRNHLTFQQMLKPLIGDGGKERPPFVPYDPPESLDLEVKEDQEFRRAFRIASRLISFKAVKVSGDENDAAIDVIINVASITKACADISLKLRPLLATDYVQIGTGTRITAQELVFEGLHAEQVSAFFVICGTRGDGKSRECVTVCPHDRFDDSELSLESRSSRVLGEILSHSNGELSQYLAHAFDLPEAAYAINDEGRNNITSSTNGRLPVPAGLYERLLDMADANPEVFRQASQLLDLIPNDVRHDELDALRRLVETFTKAVK